MIIQTEYGAGIAATPSPNYAGDVMAVKLSFRGPCKATDIVELGILPAFCQVVSATLVPTGFSGQSVTLGVLSGQPGDQADKRSVGNEFFNKAELTGPSHSYTAMKIEPVDCDRSIGMQFSADFPDDAELLLVVQYAQ